MLLRMYESSFTTTCQSSCSLMSVRVKDVHRINFLLFLLPVCNVVVIIINYGL